MTNYFSFLSPKLELITKENQKTIVANSTIVPDEIVAIWGGKVFHKKELEGKSGFVHSIDKSFCFFQPLDFQDIDSIYYIKQSKEKSNCYLSDSIKLKAKFEIQKGSEICYNSQDSIYLQKFQSNAWGLLTSIDLENCNPTTIRSIDKIRQYIIELCDLIQMNRFGETHIVHFGEEERVAGFSMFQLIETSCISGHFANQTNRSYIDIFSCKSYEPTIVGKFTRDFFEGETIRIHVLNRF